MKKLIIFDMDGVLVDVSASYRDTARKTAYLFLKDSIGGESLPDPLFTLEDLSAVKQSGGLNNDWDLSHRIITLLMSRVEAGGSNDRTEWDVSPLFKYLKTTDTPLADLLVSDADFRSDQADFYYKNDVGSGNIIKQIFQEVYLGEELFKDTYKMECSFHKEDGFILREKLFIKPEVISKWAEKNILAIATGRPRAEALYPLKKHNIDYFKIIYSLDECLEAEKEVLEKEGREVFYSKPHPFMLDRIVYEVSAEDRIDDAAAEECCSEDSRGSECNGNKNNCCSKASCEFDRLYYVGDMPDDMVAANSSEYDFKGIAVLYSAPDKAAALERLKNAGASVIAETAQELETLLG